MKLGLANRYSRIALLATITLLLTGSASAKGPVGRRWPDQQLVSIDKIDHAPLDRLLAKYVDTDGFVNYKAWQHSQQDRQALLTYLASLGQANRSRPASKSAQLAFWINAYNAVTIEGMLQEYPTDSIRNHTAKVVGYNIWKQLPLIVGADQYALEQIEHDILRKMDEPRIHFAIVCASVGCPRLRNEAYVANRIEEQLADNAKDFFSRPANFRYDAQQGTMQASEIMSWFGSDFGDSQAQQFARVKQYLPAPAQALAANPKTRLTFMDYDWSINDQARRVAGRNVQQR